MRTTAFNHKIIVTALVLSILLLISHLSIAASIYPTYHADAETLKVGIEIDQVTALAGIKLSISYDKEKLKFIDAKKTKETNSLMHVVNDKNPGKLIIVMAGAKGISGKKLEIIVLSFINLSKNSKPLEIKIDQVQLMGEDLKEISTTIMGTIPKVAPSLE